MGDRRRCRRRSRSKISRSGRVVAGRHGPARRRQAFLWKDPMRTIVDDRLRVLLVVVVSALAAGAARGDQDERICVMVAPLEADTPENQWVATAVEQGLTWSLARMAETTSIPDIWRQGGMADLKATGGDKPVDPVELGRLLGAAVVATGRCEASATEVTVRLTLQGTATGEKTECVARGRSEERRVGKECRSRGAPYH